MYYMLLGKLIKWNLVLVGEWPSQKRFGPIPETAVRQRRMPLELIKGGNVCDKNIKLS
jgi:hypothetical protein